MSDLLFKFLICPFNYLRIFKGFVHRSKTETILGHSSAANLGSEQCTFVSDTDKSYVWPERVRTAYTERAYIRRIS